MLLPTCMTYKRLADLTFTTSSLPSLFLFPGTIARSAMFLVYGTVRRDYNHCHLWCCGLLRGARCCIRGPQDTFTSTRQRQGRRCRHLVRSTPLVDAFSLCSSLLLSLCLCIVLVAGSNMPLISLESADVLTLLFAC